MRSGRVSDRPGLGPCAVEVLARLRADDFHRLSIYLETRRANPSLKFMTWIRVVTKRVGIDYLRAHPDYIDRVARASRRRGGDGACGGGHLSLRMSTMRCYVDIAWTRGRWSSWRVER